MVCGKPFHETVSALSCIRRFLLAIPNQPLAISQWPAHNLRPEFLAPKMKATNLFFDWEFIAAPRSPIHSKIDAHCGSGLNFGEFCCTMRSFLRETPGEISREAPGLLSQEKQQEKGSQGFFFTKKHFTWMFKLSKPEIHLNFVNLKLTNSFSSKPVAFSVDSF